VDDLDQRRSAVAELSTLAARGCARLANAVASKWVMCQE